MYRIDNPGWHMHRKTRNPMADVGCFMRQCAEDPVTRVMATTSMVLALCQAAGPSMVSQPPGFILINAGNEPVDPIDVLMKNLTGMSRPEPRPKPEDYERNRRTMKAMLALKQQQPSPDEAVRDFFGLPEPEGCPLAERFRTAMADNCGRGRAGWYADRRDEEFGWFTDATGHTILRLDRPEDLLQLKEDVRLHPERLIHPVGYGTRMCEESKRLSVAGSLPVADWDNYMAQGVVGLALPLLFLPHTASHPLVMPGDLAIEWIGFALAAEAVGAPDTPVDAYARLDLIQRPWFKERIARLRERLRHLPADYEFFTTRAVREMLPCCQRLAGIVAPSGTTREHRTNFGFDLFANVMQGICLGIEALGWHGFGFGNPGGHEPVRRVLRAIRERGSLSKRDLLRNQQWLTAGSRETILAELSAEGLIAITDNEITTLPFTGYWQHVLRRSFAGTPEPLWQGTPLGEKPAA
jgi:hypothetical protein